MITTILCGALLALCVYLLCAIVCAPPSEDERRMMERKDR